ncbi:hypothetical protein KC19_6G010600 [Ceratodon purpureus]|uniref:Secreted protein n=1 Tax=Ceratodon purpureus TaxID=3225 RepID=A0A8T0HDS4_CERPU|nr:hypothetical protein KC19_6G010600 [Ceratodon purpureus]
MHCENLLIVLLHLRSSLVFVSTQNSFQLFPSSKVELTATGQCSTGFQTTRRMLLTTGERWNTSPFLLDSWWSKTHQCLVVWPKWF